MTISDKNAVDMAQKSINNSYTNQANKFHQASRDVVLSLKRFDYWGLLGYLDVKQRYRRSVIGPFWLTISMGVTVTALGFLYANLFKLDLHEYLPFLALGFILWQFISGILIESCEVFVSAENIIKQSQSLFSLQVFRLVWRNLIILAHNLVIFLVVLLVFELPVGFQMLLFLPALTVAMLLGVGFGTILGILCTRFRDVGPLVQSVTQLCFFLTPIIWKPELLQGRAVFLDYNPFYHVMSILRAPLLMEPVGLLSWYVSISLAVGGLILAFLALSGVRRVLAYWL